MTPEDQLLHSNSTSENVKYIFMTYINFLNETDQ
jgi:hypothetical protein